MKNVNVTAAITLWSLWLPIITPTRDLLAQPGRSNSLAETSHSLPALQRLQAESEGTWSVVFNRETGSPRMLFGAKSKSFGTNSELAARAFVQEHRQLFFPGVADRQGAPSPELKLHAVKADMPGSAVVEFREAYDGVFVYGSSLILMVDSTRRVVHVASTTDPRVNVSIKPSRTFQQIDEIFKTAQANADIRVTNTAQNLVIYPGAPPRLCYQTFYKVGSAGEPWEYLLDANTGEILKGTRLVLDVNRKMQPRGVESDQRPRNR